MLQFGTPGSLCQRTVKSSFQAYSGTKKEACPLLPVSWLVPWGSGQAALKGMSSYPAPPVTGAEQILGVKNWGMLLQLLASHHQSHTTLYEAVAWAKNIFQKRALEKRLLVGEDCGHTFLVFLLLTCSPHRALAAVEGQGMGRALWLPCSCQCLLHPAVQQQQPGGPSLCWLMGVLDLTDPCIWDKLEPSPGSLSFGRVGRAAQWERDEVASATTAAGENLKVMPGISQLLSFPLWQTLSMSRVFVLPKKLSPVTAHGGW